MKTLFKIIFLSLFLSGILITVNSKITLANENDNEDFISIDVEDEDDPTLSSKDVIILGDNTAHSFYTDRHHIETEE